MPPEIHTVRDRIAWCYANTARADAALQEGAGEYSRLHHIIRSRLFKGLISGQMKIQSLFVDERLKMTVPQACYYCGETSCLTVDHLIPRIKGGVDNSDNLIWSCRSCNSSKHGRDMLEWMKGKGIFPPVLLLRRYVKIVTRYCEQYGCMDMALHEVEEKSLPFNLFLLPIEFPPLTELRLWIYPENA